MSELDEFRPFTVRSYEHGIPKLYNVLQLQALDAWRVHQWSARINNQPEHAVQLDQPQELVALRERILPYAQIGDRWRVNTTVRVEPPSDSLEQAGVLQEQERISFLVNGAYYPGGSFDDITAMWRPGEQDLFFSRGIRGVSGEELHKRLVTVWQPLQDALQDVCERYNKAD
ncbi:MAG: hypothetical protein OXR66_01705 [Candidatus Woesearchaeota archaeon]|nr:hypothetical protein [Candidatus Woesearchaeota archaeon]